MMIKPYVNIVPPCIPIDGKKLSFMLGIGKSASLAKRNPGSNKTAKRDNNRFMWLNFWLLMKKQ